MREVPKRSLIRVRISDGAPPRMSRFREPWQEASGHGFARGPPRGPAPGTGSRRRKKVCRPRERLHRTLLGAHPDGYRVSVEERLPSVDRRRHRIGGTDMKRATILALSLVLLVAAVQVWAHEHKAGDAKAAGMKEPTPQTLTGEVVDTG